MAPSPGILVAALLAIAEGMHAKRLYMHEIEGPESNDEFCIQAERFCVGIRNPIDSEARFCESAYDLCADDEDGEDYDDETYENQEDEDEYHRRRRGQCGCFRCQLNER